MDIKIIQIVLDVFQHYGESIRFDFERFEEALNDEVPDLLDECYLIVLGFKIGLFDVMIFDEDRDRRGYVDYLENLAKLSLSEAIFLTSTLETLVNHMGYYFEVIDMPSLLVDAYQRNDFDQLLIIAKTYFKGFGTAQDYEKAFEIYSYLYSHGDQRGAYYLGYMYEHGDGIEKNIEKALLYYQSYQDDLTNYRLGKLYMFGQYVACDHEMAYHYLSASHDERSFFYKGLLLEEKRDYAMAFEAYYQGAQLFQRECLHKAGLCLRMGVGVDIDLSKAYRCFEYGYFLQDGKSAYQLAMMLIDGVAVEKNETKAIRLLHQAAKMRCQEACLLLGQFYEMGRYVKKNHREAIAYYQMANAIEKGDTYENI